MRVTAWEVSTCLPLCACTYIFFIFTMSFIDLSSMLTPVTPKKNKKAFGGSGVSSSTEWFDCKLSNCIDFDKPGMFFLVFLGIHI